MTDRDRLARWQLRIFLACFLAYTAAYICRVNISVAIPGIQADLGIGSTALGLVGTAFFWLYAIGQLVNGLIGDKVGSRLFILAGLLASVLLNVLFGFTSALVFMILLWGANGIFQSMLWGPIVKTLSHWFPVGRNTLVTMGMSFSLIVGYLVAWGVSGSVMDRLGWRWTFWLPAAIVLVLAFAWFLLVRNHPHDVGLPDVHAPEGEVDDGTAAREALERRRIPFWKLVSGTNLLFVAVCGMTQGMVKDSISLWSPKLLMETQNLSMKSTVAIVLVIPMVNLCGILFAGWLNRTLKSDQKRTVMYLLAGSVAVSLALLYFIHVSVVASILLIGLASAFMAGANPVMTTTIPLQYRKYGRVSAIAGFIDFSIYVGSGLSGVFTGLIADLLGWNSVFLLWAVASSVGVAAMAVSIAKDRKRPVEAFDGVLAVRESAQG